MVEDLNNILNAGDVPNLYAPEDLETISGACRIECQKRKIPATKLNIFSQYITRVRKNIHLCIAMSPLGEVFRNRLRNYPSLVNCCTIDWFTNWPAEALESVGLSILQVSLCISMSLRFRVSYGYCSILVVQNQASPDSGPGQRFRVSYGYCSILF